MKYYEGPEELKNIVNYYTRLGPYIRVFYLNGDYIERYDEDYNYEEQVKKIMLKQLQERNNSININNLNIIRNINITALISLLSLYIANNVNHKNISNITILLTFISSFILYSKITDIKKIQKEVKKSKMFLEIYDLLETPEGKKSVEELEFDKLYAQELNINTLDFFTYKDVKEIHKKLKKAK